MIISKDDFTTYWCHLENYHKLLYNYFVLVWEIYGKCTSQNTSRNEFIWNDSTKEYVTIFYIFLIFNTFVSLIKYNSCICSMSTLFIIRNINQVSISNLRKTIIKSFFPHERNFQIKKTSLRIVHCLMITKINL